MAIWLQNVKGEDVLQLFAPSFTASSISSSAFNSRDELDRRNKLLFDGTAYRLSEAIPYGFRNGPLERAAGYDASDILLELTLWE